MKIKYYISLLILALISTRPLLSGIPDNTFINNYKSGCNEIQYFARSGNLSINIGGNGLFLKTDIKKSTSKEPVNKNDYTEIGFGNELLLKDHTRYISEPAYYFYDKLSNEFKEVEFYSELAYSTVDGVLVRFYFDDGRLRYDLELPAGYDISKFKMYINGAKDVIADGRKMQIKTGPGSIFSSGLYAYQYINGQKQEVDCDFRIDGNELSFVTGVYDKHKKLVIDPLVYSTYLGGKNDDEITCIKKEGKWLYTAGATISPGFPVTQGAYNETHAGGKDIFFNKYLVNDDGSLSMVYSALIGGSNFDIPSSMHINDDGSVYLAGITNSPDFPVAGNYYSGKLYGKNDIFILKIDPDGNGPGDLVYSSYLGGTDDDHCNDMFVRGNEIYITGNTASQDYPVTEGAYNKYANGQDEAFISCLNINNDKNEQLVYSTYFGGDQRDIPCAIALGEYERVIIAGHTNSDDLPLTEDAFDKSLSKWDDIFISEFDISKSGFESLRFSSYLGGNGDENCSDIIVDNNLLFLTGWTSSEDFPITDSSLSNKNNYKTGDIFLAKINLGSKKEILYSCLIGGKNEEAGLSIKTKNGLVYIAGQTFSSDFPVTDNAAGRFNNGDKEGVALIINPVNGLNNSLVYSSYYGGRSADGFTCMDVDNSTFYLGGTSTSNDLLITGPNADGIYKGKKDAMIAVIDPEMLLISGVSSDTICSGSVIDIFINSGNMAEDNLFTIEISDRFGNFGNSLILDVIESNNPGSYQVKFPKTLKPGDSYLLKVSSSNPAYESKPYGRNITVLPSPEVTLDELPGLCLYDPSLELSGGLPEGGHYSGPAVTGGYFSPMDAGVGSHTVTYTYKNEFGCAGSTEIVLEVYDFPATPKITEESGLLFSSADDGNQWYLDGDKIDGETQKFIKPIQTGSYSVNVTNENGCRSHMSEPFEYSLDSLKPELSFGPDTLSANPGEIIRIPLILTTTESLKDFGVNEITAVMKYNASLLEPAGATPKGYIINGIRIIPLELDITNNESQSIELEFLAMLGNDTATALVIDEATTNIGSIGIVEKEGFFRLDGVCMADGPRLIGEGGRVELMMIRPNPAGKFCEIEFEIVEKGTTELYLVSQSGREVKTFIKSAIPAGRRIFEADLSDVPSGAYYLVLKTPARLESVKINVAK